MITIFADELYDAHKTDYYVPSKESGIPCMPPFRKFQMRFRGATVRFSVFDNNGFVHSDFYQSLQSWILAVLEKFRAGMRTDFRSFSEIPIYLLPPEVQELASEGESLEHFLKELVPTAPLFLLQEVTYQKMPLGTVVVPLERNGNVIGDYFSMVASDDMTQEDADHFISLSEFSVFILAVLNCNNVKLKERGSSRIYQPTGKKEPKNGKYVLTVYPTKKARYIDNGVSTTKNPANRNVPRHVRRGHFGDYRNGKGLFGRTKGVFWFSDTIVGDKKNGTIEKDYRVKE